MTQMIPNTTIIIKINKSFREGMSETELYDVTRGCWKRKTASVENADCALAVVYGIVKEALLVKVIMKLQGEGGYESCHMEHREV